MGQWLRGTAIIHGVRIKRARRKIVPIFAEQRGLKYAHETTTYSVTRIHLANRRIQSYI